MLAFWLDSLSHQVPSFPIEPCSVLLCFFCICWKFRSAFVFEINECQDQHEFTSRSLDQTGSGTWISFELVSRDWKNNEKASVALVHFDIGTFHILPGNWHTMTDAGIMSLNAGGVTNDSQNTTFKNNSNLDSTVLLRTHVYVYPFYRRIWETKILLEYWLKGD